MLAANLDDIVLTLERIINHSGSIVTEQLSDTISNGPQQESRVECIGGRGMELNEVRKGLVALCLGAQGSRI